MTCDFHDQNPKTDQWTGFYMITASVMKELRVSNHFEQDILFLPGVLRNLCPWKREKLSWPWSLLAVLKLGALDCRFSSATNRQKTNDTKSYLKMASIWTFKTGVNMLKKLKTTHFLVLLYSKLAERMKIC